jgi:chorismate dehydratase
LAWKEMTGLPFVFAAWVSNKEMDADFVEQFNSANKYGLERLEEVVENFSYELYDLNFYYNNNIKYNLGQEKFETINFFLQKILNKNI